MKFLLAIIVIAQYLALGVVAQPEAGYEQIFDTGLARGRSESDIPDETAAEGGDSAAAEAEDNDPVAISRTPCDEGPVSPDDELPAPAISCVCPTVVEPVCGTDGQTYSNECVLKCVSANNIKLGRPPIEVIHKGQCRRWFCPCPSYYRPVCGTDGRTYRNECYLRCENRRLGQYGRCRPIRIKYYGPCRPKLIPCLCPNVILPVCGSDGKTYRNMCYLLCASQLNVLYGRPPIYYSYKGPCKAEICGCPRCYNPLCASNGNTFLTWCLFNCENKRRFALGLPPLYILYWGPCH